MTKRSRRAPRHEGRLRWEHSGVVAAAACAIVLLVVSGCAPKPSPVVVETRPPAAAPSAVLIPGGTAEQNLPFFNATNEKTVAANASAGSRAFIDGLVAAGFAKSEMEVTADETSVGLPAASVQFSVRVVSACLIGQYGPDSNGYRGVVAPILGTGKCLVGDTVAITW